MGTAGKGAWVVSALAYKEVEGCEGAVEDAPGFKSGHLLTGVASSPYQYQQTELDNKDALISTTSS
jgi:hypothetical protein